MLYFVIFLMPSANISVALNEAYKFFTVKPQLLKRSIASSAFCKIEENDFRITFNFVLIYPLVISACLIKDRQNSTSNNCVIWVQLFKRKTNSVLFYWHLIIILGWIWGDKLSSLSQLRLFYLVDVLHEVKSM